MKRFIPIFLLALSTLTGQAVSAEDDVPFPEFTESERIEGEAGSDFGSDISVDGNRIAIVAKVRNADGNYTKHSSQFPHVYSARTRQLLSIQKGKPMIEDDPNSFMSISRLEYKNGRLLSAAPGLSGYNFGWGALAGLGMGAAQLHGRDFVLPEKIGWNTAFGSRLAMGDNYAFIAQHGTKSNSVYSFSLNTLKETHHFASIKGVSVDADGSIGVASDPGINLVNVVNLASGSLLYQLKPEKDQPIYFGQKVAIRGDRIACSAPAEEAFYVYSARTGELTHKFHSPRSTSGFGINGFSISPNGRFVAVGAERDFKRGKKSGAVFLYDLSEDHLCAEFSPSDSFSYQYFGRTLDLSNGVLAVGSWNQSNSVVYLYHLDQSDISIGTSVLNRVGEGVVNSTSNGQRIRKSVRSGKGVTGFLGIQNKAMVSSPVRLIRSHLGKSYQLKARAYSNGKSWNVSTGIKSGRMLSSKLDANDSILIRFEIETTRKKNGSLKNIRFHSFGNDFGNRDTASLILKRK